MLLNYAFPVLALLIFGPIVLALYGISRWQTKTVARRARLQTSRDRSRMAVRHFDPDELETLPTPVQRYFRAVLTPGQPLIAVAEIGQTGQLNLARTGERWAPFIATQVIVAERPGFDWDANIRRAPGIHLFVQDAYITGSGSMKASFFGLFKVAEQDDTPEFRASELTSFLAEAVWYPTRLLPSQGVKWDPIDQESARATLCDGDTSASLTFYFDDSGMIRRVLADHRSRMENRDLVATPW